ncbi:ABC transporter permease [Corynebacterium pacaense]|uniref:ABC transporter permease n=1 Tax=Corynebacterium pacaense TaxID=1816684 RepID=UPI0009BAFC90|nr:ABC transporter permease [Corynebacterium pacaense]
MSELVSPRPAQGGGVDVLDRDHRDSAPTRVASTARSLSTVLLRRLVETLLVVWGAATIAFVAVKAIPGDPVAIMAGGENIVDAEQRRVITEQYGLDQPLGIQYLNYLLRAFRGDFGDSYVFRNPVLQVIGDNIGPTLELALAGFTLALILAFATAIATSGGKSVARTIASGAELVFLSTPVYWIGIVLLVIFSFGLGWFRVVGADGPAALVLPALALSLPLAAILSQVLRDGIENAMEQPFALTVRSRGVSESTLRLRHALRHALLSVSTVSGTLLGGVLAGSILTETVFGRPGIGQVMLLAISSRDMPLILGLVVLSALVYSLVNAIIDVGYVVIDPRLRKGTGS